MQAALERRMSLSCWPVSGSVWFCEICEIRRSPGQSLSAVMVSDIATAMQIQ